MKFIISGTFLINDPALLNEIKAVEEIGSYGDYKYKVLGDTENVTAVKDERIIVDAGDAEIFEDKIAAEKLKEAEETISKLEVEKSQAETLKSIVAEKKRGLALVDIEAFVESKNSVWDLRNLSSEDCQKWLRLQKEKEDV